MAQGNPVSYTLSIDWASAGGYPNNGDASRLVGFTIDRGRETTFAGDSTSNEAKLARNKVGTLVLTLDNWDHRYDAYNQLSPLYPNVQPGKVVRLSVTDDFTSTYVIFTGTIDKVESSGYVTNPQAVITCSDLWKQLSQQPLSTKMHFNDSPASVMREILGYVVINYVNGAPVLASQAGLGLSGSDNYPYIWGDEAIPFQVLHDLTEMDGGFCWVDVNGVFNYYPRVVVQNQIPWLVVDQSQLLDEPLVTQPWDNLKNTIQVATHDRTPGGQQVVWSIVDHAALSPGQSLSYLLTFTGANGKGVPIDPTISFPSIIFSTSPFFGIGSIILGRSVTQFIPPGGAVKVGLIITNIDTQLGYISSMTYTANPLNDLTPSQIVATDLVSITNNGARVLRLDYQYMQGAVTARAVASYYLARLKDPRAMFTVQLKNRSNLQFANDLYTLLNFTSKVLAVASLSQNIKDPTVATALNNTNSTGVVNPGVEAGTLIGWTATGAAALKETVTPWSVTSAQHHSGNNSFGFSHGPTGGFNYLLDSQPYTVTPGTVYPISVWYNITSIDGAHHILRLQTRCFNSSGTELFTGQVSLSFTATTAGWVQATANFTAPANAATLMLEADAICTVPGTATTMTCYVDDYLISGVSVPWTNKTSAFTQDGSNAYVSTWREANPVSQVYSDYLILMGLGYNFQPTDIITGIQVRIRRSTTVSPPAATGFTGGTVDYAVQLVKGGFISGNNEASAAVWTSNLSDAFYGGPADMWGLTLAYTDLNASNFGVAISVGCALCNAAEGWAQANIDVVEVTVFTNNGAFPYAFRIVGIKHETGATPYEVTTTWVFEPTPNSSTQFSPNQVYSAPTTANPLMAGITY